MFAARSVVRSTAAQLVRHQTTVAAPRRMVEKCAPRIVTMKGSNDRKLLEVQWEDGTLGEFPYVWLRDCAPVRRSTASLNDVQLDVQPEKLVLSSEGDAVLVQWPPYYKSQYSSKWLRDHLFDDGEKNKQPSIELWSKENFQDKVPCYGLADLNANRENREKLVADLERYGVVKVSGCHSARDHDALMDHVPGIKSKAGSVEKSLSTAHIVHTARAHLQNIPAVTTLRLVGEGETPVSKNVSLTLVDGFAAATDLRAAHLSMFEFLCAQKVEYVSNDGNAKAAHPMIRTDAVGGVPDMWGCITQIVFNNASRSSRIGMPTMKLGQFYSSLKHFQLFCYQSAVTLSINEGDVFLLNNHRVLHGTPAIENAKMQQTFYN